MTERAAGVLDSCHPDPWRVVSTGRSRGVGFCNGVRGLRAARVRSFFRLLGPRITPGRWSSLLHAGAKAVAWRLLQALVGAARVIVSLAGRTRRVKVILYKVDRLGDWLLVEPTVRRILAATQARGESVVVWASRESAPLRAWRPLDSPVETLVFEPHGPAARARRTWAVVRLLALYRADTFLCLRHAPDPVRDFVLQTVSAKNIYALSWRIFPGEPAAVPHEVRRHHGILASAGLAPPDIRDLLPRLDEPAGVAGPRVVIAPFSSARIKDWPDASWEAVASAFAGRVRQWELWVGPDQIARAESLAERLRQQSTAHLEISVRSGGLADLAAAIASAKIVLTVDTLAAHFAAAMDAPMVAILGGGQYGDFAPWSHSGRQRWVHYPLPCYNCGWHCIRPQNDCVQLITPGMVIAEMTLLWDRTPTSDFLPPLPAGAAGLVSRQRS